MTCDLRLSRHPVLDVSFEDRKKLTIFVDGKPLEVFEGQTLGVALWSRGLISLGLNPETGSTRGMYCGMGHCYECRVTLDGVEAVRSCLIRVREGMQVSLQGLNGPPEGDHDH